MFDNNFSDIKARMDTRIASDNTNNLIN